MFNSVNVIMATDKSSDLQVPNNHGKRKASRQDKEEYISLTP